MLQREPVHPLRGHLAAQARAGLGEGDGNAVEREGPGGRQTRDPTPDDEDAHGVAQASPPATTAGAAPGETTAGAAPAAPGMPYWATEPDGTYGQSGSASSGSPVHA